KLATARYAWHFRWMGRNRNRSTPCVENLMVVEFRSSSRPATGTFTSRRCDSRQGRAFSTTEAENLCRFRTRLPRRDLLAFLACFRKADGNRLLAALHFSALAALAGTKCSALSAPHRAPNCLARGFAVAAAA